MLKNKNCWATLLMLVSISSVAQTGTSSPYSLTGLGELKYRGFAQHTAMGGATISQQSDNSFNPANPASFASLQFTVFDVGANMSLGTLSNASLSAETRSGNFTHFAMAFPFETKKKMAVSFGTGQYSDIGYEIKNTENADTPVNYSFYKGDGGINRVYVGYGIEIIKNLNVGANVNYNFGNIQNLKAKIYPLTNNVFSYSDETYYAYRGVDLDLGVQYAVYDTIRSNKEKAGVLKHTFGGAFHTKSSLRGNGYRYSQSFFGTQFEQGNDGFIDSLIIKNNLKNTLTKPAGFTLGYTLSKGKQWSVSAEIEQNLWSSISSGGNTKYFNNTRYSAGFTIVPKPSYDVAGGFFKKVRYSAGFRFENLYYNFDTKPIQELGISFGLGLPIAKSVRLEEEKVAVVSMINITAEYVKRGQTTNGLIQEEYLNIRLGLNLNDKWFTKRKYR